MISAHEASEGRKAQREAAFQERLAHHQRATAHAQNPVVFLRDREFNTVPSLIQPQQDLDMAKFAREREAEMCALIAEERERVTMCGISTGSGT